MSVIWADVSTYHREWSTTALMCPLSSRRRKKQKDLQLKISFISPCCAAGWEIGVHVDIQAKQFFLRTGSCLSFSRTADAPRFTFISLSILKNINSVAPLRCNAIFIQKFFRLVTALEVVFVLLDHLLEFVRCSQARYEGLMHSPSLFLRTKSLQMQI